MAMIVLYYYIYVDLRENKDYDKTYYFMIFIGLLGMIEQVEFILHMGFVNMICDVNIGGVHQTMLASIMNGSRVIPSSFGIYLCDYVSYDIIFIVGLLGYMVCLGFSNKYAVALDESELSDFWITEIKDRGDVAVEVEKLVKKDE